jgi:hypothetical protein
MDKSKHSCQKVLDIVTKVLYNINTYLHLLGDDLNTLTWRHGENNQSAVQPVRD